MRLTTFRTLIVLLLLALALPAATTGPDGDYRFVERGRLSRDRGEGGSWVVVFESDHFGFHSKLELYDGERTFRLEHWGQTREHGREALEELERLRFGPTQLSAELAAWISDQR